MILTSAIFLLRLGDNLWKKLMAVFEILHSDYIHESWIPEVEGKIREVSDYVLKTESDNPNISMVKIPKWHLLSHAAKKLRESGPLMQFTAYDGERKHYYFSQKINSVKSFKNSIYTMVKNHQYNQCINNFPKSLIRETEFVDVKNIKFDDLDEEYQNILKEYFCCENVMYLNRCNAVFM